MLLTLAAAAAVLLGPTTFTTPVAMAQAAAAGPVELTFEDYPAEIFGAPAAPAIIDQYAVRGVRFPLGVTAVRFPAAIGPPLSLLPRPGERAITTCYQAFPGQVRAIAVPLCSDRIRMAFPQPLERVVLYAGTSSGLVRPATLIFEAFDAGGAVIRSSTLTLPATGREAVTPIRFPLELVDPAGRSGAPSCGGWTRT
jgi:hypothetical protein